MSHRDQMRLPLQPPPDDSAMRLVPARMASEWVYCPRLAYLEWVEGEWAGSADTVRGKLVHARVQQGGGRLPSSDKFDEEMAQARSVTMSSDRLGVIGKMDVLDILDGQPAANVAASVRQPCRLQGIPDGPHWVRRPGHWSQPPWMPRRAGGRDG